MLVGLSAHLSTPRLTCSLSHLLFHCPFPKTPLPTLSTPIGSNMGPLAHSVTDIIRFGRIVLACGANGEGGGKAEKEVGMMMERARRRGCGINKTKL